MFSFLAHLVKSLFKFFLTCFFPLRRSILLHDFDVIEPFAPLIGNPVAISRPPSLETSSSSSSMQEPPQKRQCTLLQSASPSTVETTIPINALTPYTSNWSIKGHVHDKSNLRHFNNQKGAGKVFGFDLIDKDGGEIHITCFNDSADVFYDQVLPGHVYLISKGTIKPTNKMYSHLTNEWESSCNQPPLFNIFH